MPVPVPEPVPVPTPVPTPEPTPEPKPAPDPDCWKVELGEWVESWIGGPVCVAKPGSADVGAVDLDPADLDAADTDWKDDLSEALDWKEALNGVWPF
ncbi:hypothetical protein ACFY9F_26285 [Streptomyces sp. NPDC012421]|uniref:hypothetical protein n=1 Tax=Streptomyces sp. NPDC012421 TaxID=3364832 RepID=UPI0036F16AE9